MKKNILLIVGLVLVIAGVAVAYFANFPLADLTGYGVTMLGAGLAVSQLWEKRDKTKKTWLAVLSIALIGLGAFLLGFGQFSKETTVTVMTMVFGLVSVIGGLIVAAIQQKNAKKNE